MISTRRQTALDRMPPALQKLAQSFLEEMQQAPIGRENKELVPSIPDRENLHYVEKNNERQLVLELAPQAALDGEGEAAKTLLCLAHRKNVERKGITVEHFEPFAHICDRQKILLKYLNSLPKINTNDFLKVTEMDNFFGRDQESGEIQGTKYFYTQCFNEVNNALLLCSGCNSSKSVTDPSQWIEKQNFEMPLLVSIQSSGGLHQGVIFRRIYRRAPEDDELNMSEGESVILHTGGGINYGQFVRDWFFEHFNLPITNRQQFHQIIQQSFEEKVEEIETLLCQNPTPNIDKLYQKLEKRLVASSAALDASFSDHSSSGEDSEEGKKRRSAIHSYHGKMGNNVNHQIGKIKESLTTVNGINAEEIDKLTKFCLELSQQENLMKDGWKTIRAELQQFCLSDGQKTFDGVKSEIESLWRKVAPHSQIAAEKEKTAAAEERAAEERERATEERERAVEAEERAAKERESAAETERARKIAVAEAAELKQKLADLQKQPVQSGQLGKRAGPELSPDPKRTTVATPTSPLQRPTEGISQNEAKHESQNEQHKKDEDIQTNTQDYPASPSPQ